MRFRTRLLTLLGLLLAGPVVGEPAPWYPAATLADGQPSAYSPQPRAQRPWRLCALLPHGIDRYWWGVSWGLHEEAERQGVQLGIYQAGGYQHLGRQREQLQECIQRRADALIVASISARGLNDLLREARAEGLVLIDLVNGIDSPDLTAHSRVSFADMAQATVNYLARREDLDRLSLAWLPGPTDAGWVEDGERGLRQALGPHFARLRHGGYAPPADAPQMKLVRQLFAQGAPDYLLANAVGAEVAARYIQQHGLPTRVLAYYTTEPLLPLLQTGELLAAPSDAPVLQARIAIDLAVRALEKRPHPFEVGPRIEMLDAQRLPDYPLQRLLPPEGAWFRAQPLPD